MKFPSPYNAGNITYKDKGSNCYKYEATKTECPKDKGLIKEQPIHEDFKTQKNMKNKVWDYIKNDQGTVRYQLRADYIVGHPGNRSGNYLS